VTDRVFKSNRANKDREDLPNRDLPSDLAGEAGRRREAASYLRAARLTDDASERQALRLKAAELLAPRASRGRGRAAR
jgi:hypothetical protein